MARPLHAGPAADRGEVFTRPWVADLILDLIGYTPERDLGQHVLVEPSCGAAAFLVPVVQRLAASCRAHGRDIRDLGSAVRALDLHSGNAELSRKEVVAELCIQGVAVPDAEDLAKAWVKEGDFLLADLGSCAADFVVGNPPYVRLEDVPRQLMATYRAAWPTMRGRADLYVGFIERGLDLLAPGGRLGFICADRWMHNQYGAALRTLVAERFGVETVVTMHDVDAFESDVAAYPAVVVIRNEQPTRTALAEAGPRFDGPASRKLVSWIGSGRASVRTPSFTGVLADEWFRGGDLWPATSPAAHAALTELERRFGPLEDAASGTRVGIGIASGCDDVYLTRRDDLVEADRLLPLARSADVATGYLRSDGTYLVNPWDDRGLVDLRQYPRLHGYLVAHEARLRSRYVGRRRPAQWYRTIDRVHPGLAGRAKLLLPDMKAATHPVLDEGGASGRYPHHNLYHVTSTTWDLEVLGGLLLSDYVNLFVGAYCVKMRGGCYRFQAQYLRRIRVPPGESLTAGQRRSLAAAFRQRDRERATGVAWQLYGVALPSSSGRRR